MSRTPRRDRPRGHDRARARVAISDGAREGPDSSRACTRAPRDGRLWPVLCVPLACARLSIGGSRAQFNIYKGTQQQVVKGGEHMYALEQASCPCRFFCKAQRTSTMTVTGGSGAGGPAIMSYDRPFRCMPSPCKCCCFQEMTFKDETGQSIGKVKEDFTWCAPLPPRPQIWQGELVCVWVSWSPPVPLPSLAVLLRGSGQGLARQA